MAVDRHGAAGALGELLPGPYLPALPRARSLRGRCKRAHGVELGEFPSAPSRARSGTAWPAATRSRAGSAGSELVEVSLDGGETWANAELLDDGPAGSWRLWQTGWSPGEGAHELVVRAWDSAATTQPESAARSWNLKGYVNNAWHRARLSPDG